MQTITKDQVAAKGRHLGSDQSEQVKRDFYNALAEWLNGATGSDREAKIDSVRTAILNRVAVNKSETSGVKLASVATMSKFASYAVRFKGLDDDVSLEVAARAASAGGAKTDAEAVEMAHAFKREQIAAGNAYSIRNAREKWQSAKTTDAKTETLSGVDMGQVAAWMLSQPAHVTTWAADPVNGETVSRLIDLLVPAMAVNAA